MILIKISRAIITGVLTISMFLPLLTFPTTTNEKSKNTRSVKTEDFSLNDFDTIFFDDEDDIDPFVNEFLDTVGTNQITRTIPPSAIIDTLKSIGVIDVLQQEFFLQTNPLNSRSLLDEPLFEPKRDEYERNSIFGVHFFARKTNRSNFTKDSTDFKSYVALRDEGLIELLQKSIEAASRLRGELNIDVDMIFALFQNMTVEERKAGFMLHYMKKWKRSTFRFLLPIYYLERNFFLTDDEQEEIAAEFGELDKEEQDAFQKAHFISDKLGIGDTRLEFDYRVLKHRNYTLRLGGMATLPTAFAWGKGFLGSSFAKPSTLPTFDLALLFELDETGTEDSQQELLNLLSNFLLDGFDRIAANLIDSKLGNDGHFGLGFFTRGKLKINPFFSYVNRISLEYLFPAKDKRFFINKVNKQAFDKRNFDDPNAASDNLTFLEEQIVERLFLRALNTRVRPGVIFRWTSSIHYKTERFGFNLGTDFWLQSKEQFKSIRASQKTLSEISIEKARPPLARQSKLFGGIGLRHKTYNKTWYFSLNADGTLSGRGIGNNYGLSLNFETTF